MNKKKALDDFINNFKNLPPQRSKQWLIERKFTIGGSEMGIIAGHNPYKDLRGLVENHLGLSVFNGNINTYWGSILEDLVTVILEKKMGCKIHETGSLPGVIDKQKYSPDGLAYVDFLDKIILIEIKSAVRRIANGKIPRMYKPQLYTGLDTIPIADIGLFVDALFRRCTVDDLEFNHKYDTIIHPDKPLGSPLALCLICIYEETYSTNYDLLKKKHRKSKTEWIDAGKCSQNDLEIILKDTTEHKLKFFMPSYIDNIDTHTYNMFNEFTEFVTTNKYEPIAIMPLKLFKMEIIPVERDSWKHTYNRKSKCWELPTDHVDDKKNYVQSHQETIERVVSQIRSLDKLSPEQQLEELDKLYPLDYNIPDKLSDDLINSLMFCN